MSGPGPTSLASLDGEIMPAGEATIPATDEGLVRGDGAFEVIRVYDGQPFAFEEHMARLRALGAQPAPPGRPRGGARRGLPAAGPGRQPGPTTICCGS